jgi:hypothetical protein
MDETISAIDTITLRIPLANVKGLRPFPFPIHIVLPNLQTLATPPK